MMFYFKRGTFGVPVFWKSNGMRIYFGGTPLFRESIVWWMPTNWIALPLILLMWPPALLWRWIAGTSDHRWK